MTNLANTFDSMFRDFDRFYVGSDDLVNRLSKIQGDVARGIPSYPPYNIKKIDEYAYLIEIAVAGFDQSDIDIELKEGKLTVSGKTTPTVDKKDVYLFKGIADRAFTRTFMINDDIVVRGAEMSNGMLSIALERVVPEHKLPKKIQINNVGERQLLTES